MQEVYAKVHEIMTGNLGAAGTSQGLNISPGSQGLLIVCASMRVLGVLEECCKDYANRFTHVLVKLINRVARDHASPGGFVLDSSRQAGRNRCILLHLQRVSSCTPVACRIGVGVEACALVKPSAYTEASSLNGIILRQQRMVQGFSRAG